MRILFLIVATILTLNLSAQDFEFPKGVYMNYNELMARKPSKDCDIMVAKRTITDIKFSGGAAYFIYAPKKCLKRKIIKNDVFAYSSGDSLYINGKLITGKGGYALVTEFGRFMLFEGGLAQFGKMNDIQVTSYPYMYADGKEAKKRKFNAMRNGSSQSAGPVIAGVLGGAIGGAIAGAVSANGKGGLIGNFRFYYVIDQKHNKIKTLDINTMRDFLADYPDLLAKYNKIELKHDKDVYLKYIQFMNAADAQNGE